MSAPTASFVIPARNEATNLPRTIDALTEVLRSHGVPYEIVVVDDASTDATAEATRELMRRDAAIKLVERDPPSGFGRAVRSGLAEASGDVVLIYMADASDHPEDAVAYYRKLEEGYDCVFGSRFLRGSQVENYPPVKLLVNRLANHLIRLLFLTRLNDLTNAFKAYRAEVIRGCGPYQASHFNITIEMSLSALVRGYTIAEIPISWSGRTWGSSNLRLREMGRRYLSTLLKLFFERILISDDLVAERVAASRRRPEGGRPR